MTSVHQKIYKVLIILNVSLYMRKKGIKKNFQNQREKCINILRGACVPKVTKAV